MDIAAERSYPTPLANVTLLPMLLMSLMRQKNCPRSAESVKREYDYIIVGAGSAGSVVASRLSELPCVSVLLLEAGKSPPLLTDVPALSRFFWFTDIDWQYKTVPQKRTGSLLNNRQVVWPSGKAIGGSSILNGMLYVRGNQKNFDQWAAEGAEGWSYNDVLPYFKKMEDNRDPEYIANGYHGIRGPQTIHRPRYQPEMKDPIFEAVTSMGYKIVDPNGIFQTGFYDLQSTMRSGQRCSSAKAYLVPAENRTNLDVLSNAFVKKVLIKKRRAVGVQFDYEGKTYIVNAKREVIISAGTVNTAQLLMLSGIGPRTELERLQIPVVAELPVGKNLQDHCSSNVDFELGSSIQPYMEKLTDLNNVAQYIKNRTGPLGSSEFYNAVAFLKNKVIEPDQDFPDHQIAFSESHSGAGLQYGLTPEVQNKIYEPYEGRPFYSCFSSLLHPRSRGTVTLQSNDPYDAPLIDPNYFDDPKDMDDLIEGLKVCNRIGNSAALKKVGSKPRKTLIPGCEKYAQNEDLYLRCQVRSVIMTASHPVGTVRMGNSRDPRTVVDSELRVKTLNGLRIVDASIMPIIPSGSTYAATIMVAEKASDIIKSSITCHNEETDDDRFPVLEEIAFSGGPINFSRQASQPADKEDQTKGRDNTEGAADSTEKSMDKPKYGYISHNTKQSNPASRSSEIQRLSKDNVLVRSQDSAITTNKPLYGYVPQNKKLRNSESQSSETQRLSKDNVLVRSQASQKATNKPLYGYVPQNKKQGNSESQSSDTQRLSKDNVLVRSQASQKTTIKPQYGYAPLNKNKWKDSLLQDFSKNEDTLSSDPWNQEVISSHFTDFELSGNDRFFKNGDNEFNILSVNPYVKQAKTTSHTVGSVSEKESLSENDENDKDLQTQSTPLAKINRPKPGRPPKTSQVNVPPQKTITKSVSITFSKNRNKKILPSKFDTLRVKIEKQKPFLTSVENNAKNIFEIAQENLKQPEPDLQTESSTANPNHELLSDSELNFDPDSSENTEFASSCEKNFCDSLIKFIKCEGTDSCQKKAELASLLFQLLCTNNK